MAGFVVIDRFVFIFSFLLAERTQVILPPLFLAAGRYQLYLKNSPVINKMKIEINLVNQIQNLAWSIIISAFYYSLLIYLNKDFLNLWFSHIPVIIFFIPTLCVHISYLMENYDNQYFVDQNYIVDLKSKKKYDKDSILKIEVHKFE